MTHQTIGTCIMSAHIERDLEPQSVNWRTRNSDSNKVIYSLTVQYKNSWSKLFSAKIINGAIFWVK